MAIDEVSYQQGQQMIARRIMGACIQVLGSEGSQESWRLERADMVSLLRSLCARYGDNNWSDNDHLGDVLDKCLIKHLELQ